MSKIIYLIPLLLFLFACAQVAQEPDYASYCAPGVEIVSLCGEYIQTQGDERFYYEQGTTTPIDCDNDPNCGDALHTLCEEKHVCETGDDDTKFCCEALTASCLACSQDVSIEEYCAENPETPGCDIKPDMAEYIPCEEPRPEICTQQYDPVCSKVDTGVRCIRAPCPDASEDKTYGNACSACADANVMGYYEGACEDLYPDTPPEGKKFALCENAPDWIKDVEDLYECVGSCPAGYDGYMTQIGLEVCIEHIGEEDFEDLPACTKSSSTCDCTYISHATDGTLLELGYRCLPDELSHIEEYYIHMAGICTKDMTGQESCAIA